MIEIRKQPGQRIIELGGGDNPHPDVDVNVDVRSGPKVHFQQDFSQFPWDTIGSNEFDCCIAHFVMEHVPFRLVPQFLGEVLRILKPGGKAVFALPNTEAQFEWIKANPNGWDGKGPFESMSEIIFGSQDYDENSHSIYVNPIIAQTLFQEAGFINVLTAPYGARSTDLSVVAEKPGQFLGPNVVGSEWDEELCGKANPQDPSKTCQLPKGHAGKHKG